MPRFVLRFTNVVCSRDGETFDTCAAAVERGRDAGFEFSVWRGDRRVASWSVFGGLAVFPGAT